MCNVFGDAEGILLIDYMPHKITITETIDLLRNLHVTCCDVTVKEKCRGKLTQVPAFA